MSDMASPLRGGEFRVGQALNTSFRVLLRNIVSFMLTAIIVSIPAAIVVLLLGVGLAQVSQALAGGVAIVAFVLTFAVLLAALTYGTVEDLRGSKPSPGAIISHAMAVALPALAVSLLLAVMVSVGLLALLVPGVILMCVFYVAVPVAVVERPGVFKSLGRSAELTRGNRWRMFAVVILSYLVSIVVEILGSAVEELFSGSTTLTIVGAVIGIVLALFSITWSSVLVAVVYHDLRVAKEGINAAQIAAVFD